MSRTGWLLWTYRLLLSLYPRAFRSQWGAEMEATFAEAVAAVHGGPALLRLVGREFLSLPLLALRSHLQPGCPGCLGKPSCEPGWETPVRMPEQLAVVGLLSLPGLGVLIGMPVSRLLPLLGGILLLLLLAGLWLGFPRWSLPVMGLSLSTFSFIYLLQGFTSQSVPPVFSVWVGSVSDPGQELVVEAFWAGLLWFSLFALAALGLGVLALVGRFRQLLDRLRRDWTLGSYLLYCAGMLMLLLANIQAPSQPVHALLINMGLVAGAWSYLRSQGRLTRVASLLAGLTVASGAVIAGEWQLDGLRNLAARLTLSGLTETQMLFLQRTALDWAWLVVFILAPAVLRWLPLRSFVRLGDG